MVESTVIAKSTRNVWFDVLEAWCPKEVLDTFIFLESEDAKDKMLDALKAKVMHTLLEQNKKERFNKISKNFPMRIEKAASTSVGLPSHQKKLLKQAVRCEGSSLTFHNFSHMKEELSSWGTEKKIADVIQEHMEKSEIFKARFINNSKSNDMSVLQHFKTLSSDATVTKHGLKTIDVDKLKKIQIKDLKLFQTNVGCYLEGKLLGYARLLVGLTTLLEDDDKNVVQVTIYNAIPDGPDKFSLAEKMFPHGQKIKIVEPFMKIFRDGNRGVRVDDPNDICIMNNAKDNIDDIRKIGKKLMDSEQYILAFELYYNGARSHSDLLIPLLNNRAQTEIKLEQYEEALLDASAVLFFKQDEKAQHRYNFAYKKLLQGTEEHNIIDIWKRVLRDDMFVQRDSNVIGSKKAGNELYAAGEYILAKKEYTSAISFPDMSVLLTNVALVCVQLGMLHTAISACTACLRISNDNHRKQKAYYCMAKSFLYLRKPELYNLISPYIDFRAELDKMNFVIKNCETIFQKTVAKCNPDHDYSVSDLVEFYSRSCDLVSDFIQPETIEHVYIDGKGRGIRALRDIRKGELLLVDHPIVGQGTDVTKTKTFTRSFNFNTHIAYGIGDVKLVTYLLTLVKYDGLLAKKLLCLERKAQNSGKFLSLLDLTQFSYRYFSEDIPPFLPQTNEVVGIDVRKINEVLIQDILTVNTFNHDAADKDAFCKGSALCLRISLFNHDNDFNCRVLPFGHALVIFPMTDILKGSELTIFYNENCEWK